jgi:hypothetical protein
MRVGMNWKHLQKKAPANSHCNKIQFVLFFFVLMRYVGRICGRDGRVVEGARLESVYTATYRGFEPLSLRQ